MKIITFSFAGGSKFSFQKFSQNLSNFIVVEYPGRGMRIKEKLMIDIDLLIEDLLPKVKAEINSCEQYIIYGHSMGALIGYLICHKIKELGIKKPLKLVVGGKKPPLIRREKVLSYMSDSQFWEEVIKKGGIPNELQNYTELMDFYLPILKADFRVVENYNHIKTGKLNLPIDVFYGTEEDITENEIIGWKNESTEEVTITALEGNHFFIFNHVDFFANYFKNTNH